MPRLNRRKSIVTPPRRDRIAPSRRTPMPDDGPTDFTLQRQAERIGLGTVCDVTTKRVDIVGGAQNRARAEFASSSSLALLLDRKQIEHRHYRAGSEYARLRRLLFGRSAPKPSSLAKVMALDLNQRIEAANAAARDEMDDEAYAEWLAEQRTLFERGEYRLTHMQGSATSRRLIRIALRAVVLDDLMPEHPVHLARLRRGLGELADVWGFE